MNPRLIRFVVALASAAVVSTMGAGIANAATVDRLDAEIAAVGGQTDTHATAEYLRQLHAYLAGAADQDEVAAVRAAVEDLRPVLRVVSKAPVERAAVALTDRADTQAAQLERDLPGLSILAPVAGLVSSLLTTLLDLVTNLLGGLPVPLPVPDVPLPLPPLPGVPTPDVPTPDVPVPDVPVPDVPVPDVPAPDVPAPDVPAPDVPAPDVPAPDVPAPDVPAPDVPAPDVPAPDVPAPEVPAPDVP